MARNRLLAAALLAAGGLLVAAGAGGYLYAAGRPALQAAHPDPHLSESASAGRTPAELAANLAQISSYAANRRADPRPDQPRTGLWIEIPALQISLPVREGDGGDRVPQWQALHYPGTSAPGASGNSYVYAHGLWGMFGGLLYARTGDEVDLHDYGSGSRQVLHVSQVVGKIPWNDTRWIHATAEKPTLTLQTCVDDNVRGSRYIVQAT